VSNGGRLDNEAAEAPASAEFEAFVAVDGERLRRVVAAHFGVEVGGEVSADALAWAWEHWEQVRAMANPVGYLYRVAQSSARRHRRWRRPVGLLPQPHDELAGVEPGLDVALAQLPRAQRVAVLLVHGLGWSYQETADAMGVPVSSVRNYVHRGLGGLRKTLGGLS
jgi:RNA polymerase sigma-70 factor (ECF subfamily)